jgi:hypothetical protein
MQELAMRHRFTALALAAGLVAASAALAQETEENAAPAKPVESSSGMAGNTQFLIGQTFLADYWKPLDEPSSFGVKVDFAPKTSHVRVALGLNFGGGSKNVNTPFFNQTGKVGAGFLEFSAGFLWLPVKHAPVRPYLGAGVVRVFAGIGSGSEFWSGGESDQSFGFYGNGGIYFKVGNTFNIGLDGRIVRGTKITLAGVEGDVNYGQGSLLLGFSWGE